MIAVGLSLGHSYAWELDTAPSLPPDYKLVAPDLDGDGRADVALFVGASIYEGLSRPWETRFAWQSPYVPQVREPHFADVDGDGRADLVGDSRPESRDLSYQLRLPTGGYAEMVAGPTVCPVYNTDPIVLTADLDGDGFTDSLCISQEVSKAPPVDGEFESISRYRVNDRRSVVAALNRHRWMRIDVDGDGALELVNISYANPGYTVRVVWPQAGYETTYTVTPGYSPAALGDLFGLTEPNTGRWIPMEVGGPGGPSDGKTDLVLVEPADGNTVRITTLLSLGGGQFLPVQSVVAVGDPTISNIGVQDGVNIPGWMPADLDGDDWSDLVRIRPNRVGSGGGGAVVDTLHATGGGHFENASFAAVYFAGALDTTARWFQPTDVDGDGRTDFVHVSADAGGSLVIHTLRARGDGDFEELLSTPGIDVIAPASWRLVDIDGDGIVDLVHAMRDPVAGSQCLQIDELVGDGNGRFVTPSRGAACVDAGGWPRLFDESRTVTAIDLDGDGRPELVHATHLDNRLVVTRLSSAGGGWHAEPTAFSLTADLGNAWAWNPSSDPVTGFTGLWYGDGTGFESLRWERTRDELIAIDNGVGLHTDIEYQTGGSIAAGRGSLPAGMIPRVVRQVATSDMVSNTGDFASYAYNTPVWSSRERQLLGFASRTTSTPRNSITEAFAVDDACRSRSTMRSTYDLSSALLMQVATEYEPLAAVPPYRCVVTRVARTECESDGCRSGEDAWFHTTAEGNIDVSSSTADSGPFVQIESWFALNAKAYILDRFTRTFTFGWDPIGWWSQVDWREREYEPGDTGDVKKEFAFATDHATSYVTTYTHDEHGNVTDVVSPGKKHTHVDSDPIYGRYPVRACTGDGLPLCTSTSWDYTLGVVASTTDANSATTTTHRDPHGRVDDVTGPGGHAHTDYVDTGTSTQRITTKVDDGSPGDHVLVTEAYHDGSGRTYRTTHEGGATISTIYSDSSSRPLQVSEVHDASVLPTLFTTFSYDALGRPHSIVHPDGTHADSSYQRGQVTVKDELGHEQRRHVDGRGQVIAVDEIVTDRGTPVTRTTTYRHEITGRLLEIWDPAGNLTTFEYDAGRLVTATDPDRGRRSYAYEPDGELEHVTDTLGNTITYEHDEFGHTTSRTDADKQGNVERHIDWHHDNVGAVHGSSKSRVYRIDDAQSSGAGTTMSTDLWYDEAGRVTDSSTCVSGRCFDQHRHFDPAGRIDYVVYPNAAGSTTGPGAETVTYTYDPTGTLHSLGGYATYTYELDGRVKTATFGNGTTTTYTYNPVRRWTEHVDLDGPRGPILHLGYEHDATGRITRQLGTGVQPTDLVYHYDELGRLTEVMSNDGVRDEYAHYDAIGRIHDTNRLGVVRYDDPLHLHGVTSTTAGSQRAYDANGNATTIVDGTRRSLAATWTIDGHIADITATATGDRHAYGYDAGGRRVEKSGPTGTSRYFGPELELDPSGKLVKYYSANGQLVARNDGAVYYFHADVAHATRLETGAKGKLVNSYEYWAFGEPYRTTEAADHDIGFSGARTDDALDLVAMGARTYDPVLGRFLSADSLIPDPYRPQSLDRYSYVENDPINHYDPSGHMRADIEVMKERKQQMRTATYQLMQMLADGAVAQYQLTQLRDALVMGYHLKTEAADRARRAEIARIKALAVQQAQAQAERETAYWNDLANNGFGPPPLTPETFWEAKPIAMNDSKLENACFPPDPGSADHGVATFMAVAGAAFVTGAVLASDNPAALLSRFVERVSLIANNPIVKSASGVGRSAMWLYQTVEASRERNPTLRALETAYYATGASIALTSTAIVGAGWAAGLSSVVEMGLLLGTSLTGVSIALSIDLKLSRFRAQQEVAKEERARRNGLDGSIQILGVGRFPPIGFGTRLDPGGGL